MSNRGIVLGLTQQQKVTRARYLAGQVPLAALDEHVRRDALNLATMTGYALRTASGDLPIGVGVATFADLVLSHIWCPALYYRLAFPNGGTDPTAPDPAVREQHPGVVARLVDCSGGGFWCQGMDRWLLGVELEGYASTLGKYRGTALNTNSVVRVAQLGARNPGLTILAEPEPGCIVTCESGSPGHKTGHQGTVVAFHGAHWDPTKRACWENLEVVDCAMRHAPNGTAARTNEATTGAGWYGTGARFIRVELPAHPGVKV